MEDIDETGGVMKFAWMIAALFALFALSGCTTVGPNYQRPDLTAPEQWSSGDKPFGADAPISKTVAKPFDGSRWWSVFHDAELDRLVDEAVAQNIDLQTAALRIAAARVQRDQAADAALPSLAGNGVAGRSRQSANGIASTLGGGSSSSSGSADSTGGSAESSPSLTSNFFQAGFDATWELDLWGKTRRSVEAADASTRGAQEQRNDAAASLTAEIVRTYMSLRGSQRQLAIARDDIATQEHVLRLAKSRSDAGLSPSTDVITQRSTLSQAQAQLPQVEQAIDQSTNRLALLMALPPGALRTRLSAAAPVGALPPEVPVGLPGDLLRRRPDVRRSEAQLQSATAQIGVATANLFPTIQLGLFGGLQASRASDLFDWASRFAAGGAAVTLPIFEGGRLRAAVRIADIQQQQAVLAYRQSVLAAYHDAENALIAYADEQRRTTSLQSQVDDAKHSRTLAESKYRVGLATYIEVLDADRTAHQADLSLSQSLVTSSTNLVALYKALGGGWTDDLQQTAR
ncbi:MAG: transporter [Rhizobacter sp.]|nr:transporter [Rhizobacter sp.]